jgi:predicted double-glycine peptidase
VLHVPLVRQATSYSCGAAALLAVLFYWQAYDGHESSLYEDLAVTPEDGCEPNKIVEVARSMGLLAEACHMQSLDSLKNGLLRGDTVIVAIQAWVDEGVPVWQNLWQDGHYVVLIGMNEHNLYFMDPSLPGCYGYLPHQEFLDRWHDVSYDGKPQIQLAIYIRGEKALPTFPRPFARIG